MENYKRRNCWELKLSFVTFRGIALLIIALLLYSCKQGGWPGKEEMIHIPAGKFIIGSNDEDTNQLAKEFGARQKVFFMNERPVRELYLKDFYIDKFEVTNRDYKKFVESTGYPPPPHWKYGTYDQKRKIHSVMRVSWFDADAYCKWLGKRLPVEEEWEKAARGPNGNKYPWGNEFDEKKANLRQGDTVPAGKMANDKSFYGVMIWVVILWSGRIPGMGLIPAQLFS